MPQTPYLLIDQARACRNVRRAAESAARAGVALRPHVKTHKLADLARLQLGAGASGITVATIGEAEVFAEHGCDDIFVAYPLWVDDRRAERVRDLLARIRLRVGVDSVAGAAQLGLHLGRERIEVVIEVDSGHHRSGARPVDAGRIADGARRAGLDVVGVFTFPGHSYAPEAAETAADDERTALATAAEMLRTEGIEPRVVSGGSTPTLDASLADPGPLTELRPGVYALGDAQQWALGTMDPDDLALTCRATVISRSGGRTVVDAGSKALGADRPAYVPGHGRVLDDPGATVVMLSEHHAVIEMSGAPPAIGSTLDLVPNHVCNAMNLVDEVYVDHGGDVRAWPVVARGRNH